MSAGSCVERYLNGLPLILVDQGRPLKEFMHRGRADEQDILTAAPEKHGWERMEQIKYAILETNGMISIVPRGNSRGVPSVHATM